MQIHIENYREKGLLIALYFYRKQKKELTRNEVYDMWRNWFSEDFKDNKNQPLKMVNDKLVISKKNHTKDEMILCERYNKIFDSAFGWIEASVKNKHNSELYLKNELDKIRKQGLWRLCSYAKSLDWSVVLSKKKLYKNELGYYQVIKNGKIINSGNCDKMIVYLKQMKKEKCVNE